MRKLERDIRQLKRNMIGYSSAGGEECQKAFENAAILLQQKNRAYNSFGSAAGLKKRLASTQVQGFDRAMAARAKGYYKK